MVTALPADQVPGLHLQPSLSDWSWSSAPRLLADLLRARPEAVLIVYFGSAYRRHPMVTLLPGVLRRLRPRIRLACYITYPMGSDPRISARPVSRLVRRLCGASRSDPEFGTLLTDTDRVLCMSGWQRATLLEHCPGLDSRIVLSPPPPLIAMRSDAPRARAEGRARLGLNDADELVAYLGYFYESKGVSHLLDACRDLIRGGRRLHLVLVGGRGDFGMDITDQLQQQVAAAGLEGRVHWSGEFPVDSPLPSTLLHAADVAALPFEHGAQLNHSSLATVVAHGLPLVTTYRAATTDSVFVDGDNALLCPLLDAAALAHALARLLDDSVLRRRLREGSLTLARDWYSVERLDERLDDALDRTGRGRSLPSRHALS